VSNVRVWRALLGVESAVIERVEFDEDEQVLVVRVRPGRRARGRCGQCLRRRRGYDQGDGRRRWRHLDAGLLQVWLEADAPRVSCPQHGVVVAHVPWARHDAGHTRAFDDTVAWLATAAAKSTVCELLRIAWRTVGSIITRVAGEAMATRDRFAGLRRLGIDEISFKRGHRYLTVVVDHDTRRLVWAAPGRDKATLNKFFDALGEERCAQITHVTADAADWIAAVVAARCPNAVQCADPFYVDLPVMPTCSASVQVRTLLALQRSA
jgi:transposase